jgi:hypothetical protein
MQEGIRVAHYLPAGGGELTLATATTTTTLKLA